MSTGRSIKLTVNGMDYERSAEARMSLADFLRNELDLTGTHLGCEHGVCGACTVLLNGDAVRSCLMLAVAGCTLAPSPASAPSKSPAWFKTETPCSLRRCPT